MELNVPGIIDAALPRNKGSRNVGVIANNLNGPNHNDPGFLSDDYPRSPPKLYITSEEDEFDLETIEAWKKEGFNVEYLPRGAGGKEYKLKLDGLRKVGLGPCETFGIVAFGEAASACLEHFHILDNNPDFKLSLLVAYYPTRIPDPNYRYPGGVQVLVHLAGTEVSVIKQSQMIGIQGKKRLTRRKFNRGLGAGGTLGKWAWPAFCYPDADAGFAERDLDEFDKVSADLAWSRSLGAAKRAFRWGVDGAAQAIMEENLDGKFYSCDEKKLMSTYVDHKEPTSTYMPTLTGGIGAEELQKFYSQFFIHDNPPSLELTLISRTSSADHVVDELHVLFKHTQEMPWILPGVPPTNRRVEIMIVSVVTLRGGKLYQERIYWDQASVLVQTGLLNPEMVPKKAKRLGVERLPIVGKQPARRVIEGGYDDGEGEADNELIPDFWDEDEDDEEEEEEEDEEEGEEEDYEEEGEKEAQHEEPVEQGKQEQSTEAKAPVESAQGVEAEEGGDQDEFDDAGDGQYEDDEDSEEVEEPQTPESPTNPGAKQLEAGIGKMDLKGKHTASDVSNHATVEDAEESG
ncbi:hypothetical protein BX600DRAFT_431315 [Xylariales sp. PMI_506]|nr:hypothetical protein BX600DRAFT_431315 [Xylariales sp. PMI_506]